MMQVIILPIACFASHLITVLLKQIKKTLFQKILANLLKEKDNIFLELQCQSSQTFL